MVLLFLGHAHDHVHICVQCLNERRNFLRWMLQVVVHGNDDPAPRLGESAQRGIALAGVAHELDHHNGQVFRRQRLQHQPGIVGAAIFHEDDLVSCIQTLHDAGKPVVQFWKHPRRAIHRDDDAVREHDRAVLIASHQAPFGCAIPIIRG